MTVRCQGKLACMLLERSRCRHGSSHRIDITSNKSTYGTVNEEGPYVEASMAVVKAWEDPKKPRDATSNRQTNSADANGVKDCRDLRLERFALDRYLNTPEPHEQVALGHDRTVGNGRAT